MTSEERIDYTNSVKCMMKLPPKTPKEALPGATSRYDDFVGTHINNTLLIHNDGTFLAWHRHFLHLFQEAMTTECGYKGTIPYWNWPWWTDDLLASPLFDGSATSLSGDGYYNASVPAWVNGNFTFPRGNGGGCIKEGPFVNITTGFRNFKNGEIHRASLPSDALDYFPRCVTRDINSGLLSTSVQSSTVHALLNADSIGTFQFIMDDLVNNTDNLGPHAGGHFSLGAGLQDQYASPADPAFFLHHGMIDNLWTNWQLQDPETRTFALEGTVTTFNYPPSQNVTLDWEMNFGWLDTPKKMEEMMNVTKYCYRYEYDENAQKPT